MYATVSDINGLRNPSTNGFAYIISATSMQTCPASTRWVGTKRRCIPRDWCSTHRPRYLEGALGPNRQGLLLPQYTRHACESRRSGQNFAQCSTTNAANQFCTTNTVSSTAMFTDNVFLEAATRRMRLAPPLRHGRSTSRRATVAWLVSLPASGSISIRLKMRCGQDALARGRLGHPNAVLTTYKCAIQRPVCSSTSSQQLVGRSQGWRR